MLGIKRKHLALPLFTLVALPLSKLQPTTTTYSYQQPKKEKSNKNKTPSKALIITSLAIVVTVGGAGAYWSTTQSTTKENTNDHSSTSGTSSKKSKKQKKAKFKKNSKVNTSSWDDMSNDGEPPIIPLPPITHLEQSSVIRPPNQPFFIHEEKKENTPPINVNTNSQTKPLLPNPMPKPKRFVARPKTLDISTIIESEVNPLIDQEKEEKKLEELKALCDNVLPKGLNKFIERKNTGKVVKKHFWSVMSLFLTKEILQHLKTKQDAIDKTILYKDEVLYGNDKQDENPLDDVAEEIKRKERICDRFKNFLNQHKQEHAKAKEYFNRIKLDDSLKNSHYRNTDIVVNRPFQDFKSSSKQTTLASMYNKKTTLSQVQLQRYTKHGNRESYNLDKNPNSYPYKAVVKWRHEVLLPCWKHLKELEYDEKGEAIQQLLPEHLKNLLNTHNCTDLWNWITPLEQHKPQNNDRYYACIVKLLYAAVQHTTSYTIVYNTKNTKSTVLRGYKDRLKELYERIES